MRDVIDVLTGAVIAAAGFFIAAVGSIYFVALAARGAWHLRLVQKEERRLVDALLARDAIIVLLAVWVGEALAHVAMKILGLEPAAFEPVWRGTVAALAYLGPEGVLALVPRFWRGEGK